MLKSISKLGAILNNNEKKNIFGGRNSDSISGASKFCDYIHDACHKQNDSDSMYMSCMRNFSCDQEA